METSAGVSLAAARVGARDVSALSQFYQSTLGMREFNRLEIDGRVEVFLNFGATPEAAAANPAPLLLILQREADTGADAETHLVFYVADLARISGAIVAAGGQPEGEPLHYAGLVIGFFTDPAGNRFELLQRGG